MLNPTRGANTPTPIPNSTIDIKKPAMPIATPFPPRAAGRRPITSASISSARTRGPLALGARSVRNRAPTGMNMNDNRSEMTSARMIVIGKIRMNPPRIPPINNIGAKTNTVVIVPDALAAPTRLMARRMTDRSCSTSSPSSCSSSRNASMDSVITMASSTNRPRARIRANSEIVFSVMPTINSAPTDTDRTVNKNSDVRIEARHEMSNSATIATTITPSNTFDWSEEICCSTTRALSIATRVVKPSGRPPRASSIAA